MLVVGDVGPGGLAPGDYQITIRATDQQGVRYDKTFDIPVQHFVWADDLGAGLGETRPLAPPVAGDTPPFDFNGDGTRDFLISVSTNWYSSANIGIVYGLPGVEQYTQAWYDLQAKAYDLGTDLAATGKGLRITISGDTYWDSWLGVTGDFNGDGKTDYVTVLTDRAGNNGTMFVVYGGVAQSDYVASSYSQQPDGRAALVEPPLSYSQQYQTAMSRAVLAADLNHDGSTDLVVLTSAMPNYSYRWLTYDPQYHEHYTIIWGSGPGSTQPQNSMSFNDLHGPTAAQLPDGFDINPINSYAGYVGVAQDIDRDGISDLLFNGNDLWLSATHQMLYGAGATLNVLQAVGDVNGDGKADYAVNVGYEDSFVVTSGLLQFLNDGGINAVNNADGFHVTGGAAVFAGDLNGDGLGDIIIQGSTWNGHYSNAIVNGAVGLGGSGPVGLDTAGAFNVYSHTWLPFQSLGDLNGDGRGDLSIAGSSGWFDWRTYVPGQDFSAYNFINGTSAPETITGTAGSDFIAGHGGSDILIGGAGDDVLVSGGGDTTLVGGTGADRLVGGYGVDTFVYHSASEGGDTIVNFNTYDGDVIDIRDVLTGFNPTTSAISDFLSLQEQGGNTTVMVDADGAGSAEAPVAFVTLQNVTGLLLDDLLLQGNLLAA